MAADEHRRADEAGHPSIDLKKIAKALGTEPATRIPVRDRHGPLGALALREAFRRLRGDVGSGTS